MTEVTKDTELEPIFTTIDRLLEENNLQDIVKSIDQANLPNVTLYIEQVVDNSPLDQRVALLNTLRGIQLHFGGEIEGFLTALRVFHLTNDPTLVQDSFNRVQDNHDMLHQMCFILAANGQVSLAPSDLDNVSKSILGNRLLSRTFNLLADRLDLNEPKTLEAIFRSHDADGTRVRPSLLGTDTVSMLDSLVNAVVNAGFGTDGLFTSVEKRSPDPAAHVAGINRLVMTASLGFIHMWSFDEGPNKIAPYLLCEDNDVVAGACLALGTVFAGVQSDYDVPLHMLTPHLSSSEERIRVCAALGIGIAYAGTDRGDVVETLLSADIQGDYRFGAHIALAVGLIAIRTGNAAYANIVIALTAEVPAETIEASQYTKLYALSLALMFFGQKDAESTVADDLLTAWPDKPRAMAAALVRATAIAGHSDVLAHQDAAHSLAALLSEDRTVESDFIKKKSEDDANPGLSDKPTSLAAMFAARDQPKSAPVPTDEASPLPPTLMALSLGHLGDDLTQPLLGRLFDRIHHYGTTASQRVLPLAASMGSLGVPDQALAAGLHRMAHNSDEAASFNAIVSLGLLGAGTGDAHIAQTLKTLRKYYKSSSVHQGAVRLAHGLLHAGKGLIGVHTVHMDKKLLRPTAIAGILTTALAMCSHESFLKEDMILFFPLALAMTPRCVSTVDAALNPIGASVKVGQKIDIVGLAGKPRKIAGFQSHVSPVVCGLDNVAEVVEGEFEPLTSLHEGVLICKVHKDVEHDDVD
ncbi:hypothetical protein J8273_5818 [Carpediemonas membranifera]|uniref:26S proteasome non-ATPase regulatory subunit 2 n=1 Tax=Carpediemonas membranifera TaxID=201153 RepID=A0A8J6E194_9EUKA|nr:hypothetical protein J8273_5818 [Carpediemonas membranifera]|eukprot:KAG9392786.1 hypothetical protein J8273_5818 [Carpediemonas membranifera]